MVNSIGSGLSTLGLQNFRERYPEGIKALSMDSLPTTLKAHRVVNQDPLTIITRSTLDAVDTSIAKNDIVPLVAQKNALEHEISNIGADTTPDQASLETRAASQLEELSTVQSQLDRYVGTPAYARFLSIYDEKGNALS